MCICLKYLVLVLFYSMGKVSEEKEMDKKETFQLWFSMDNDIIA
jgi:hypothetical protein